MQFKSGQLVKILGCSAATESKWIDSINAACAKFGIDTKLRLAAFIAQVGHESANLTAVSENLNYSANSLQATWPTRFPDAATAQTYARKPMLIANKVYGGRMGNGAEVTGDGWKYRGRGLIECTGKSNYDAFSQACGVDAVNNPDSLAEPSNASLSAAWFWSSKGLNAYADRGDFLSITKRINGGTIGQENRERLYKKALIVLGDQEPPKTDEELDNTPVPPSPETVTAPINEQKAPAARNSSIVEPRAASSFGASKYPWNLVYESRSGHVTEIDDTPGAERLNMTHRTGSYWEITPDGVFTHKSILDSYRLTKEDSFDYTGADHTSQVKGNAFYTVGGTLRFNTGPFYAQAPVIYLQTGMVNVTGEVNAAQVNAPMFSNLGGKGGMAWGELVAKEAVVAYYVKKGKAPMFGGSFGFTGTPGLEGSADGMMTNTLSKQAPNGTPWITNGVNPDTVSAADSVAVAAAVVAGLMQANETDEHVANAMNSAASSLDSSEALSDAAQTPVFLKHVTFDKPTLLSMSTVLHKPDPSLYMNNYHTIVDSNGVGVLHFSNGVDWIPVGEAGAKGYVDQQVSLVQTSVDDEISARAAAILNESLARSADITAEAEARHTEITQGLLTEAQDRDAAVTAEATSRQLADQSLSDLITTLTASLNENAAAIQTEQTARVDADTAEATSRTALATIVNDNTTAISTEVTARSNADSALTTSISQLSSSTDDRFATVNTSITTLTNADTATSTRIDGLDAKTDTTNAAVLTEQTARADADTALSSRIDTVSATSDSNFAAVQTQAEANATNIGNVSAQWGVKVDVNGNVVGMALIEDLIAGSPVSKFQVDADQFVIAKAGTGARLVMSNQLMQIFDSNNVLRVKLGIW